MARLGHFQPELDILPVPEDMAGNSSLKCPNGAGGESASKPTSTNPGDVANQFTAALENAARRGVAVTTIADAMART
jgi:hypothetical protein